MPHPSTSCMQHVALYMMRGKQLHARILYGIERGPIPCNCNVLHGHIKDLPYIVVKVVVFNEISIPRLHKFESNI